MSPSRRNAIRVIFGRHLRALRKWRGHTQEVLGERAGVSGKLIGQIERGLGNPTLEVIDGLARALRLDPAALLQFEPGHGGLDGEAVRPAARLMAAEKVARYLEPRSAEDVERALRIIEAALGDSPPVR